MEISELKQYIYENEKIEFVLEELDFHSIKPHKDNSYFTCGFKDGDNKKALVVYNSEFLNIESYTRPIINKNGFKPSLIDVVCYVKDMYISNAVKWLSEILGLDYYSSPYDNMPLSLQWTKLLIEMKEENQEKLETPLKPINEYLLTYYKPYVNDIFYEDGVNYHTQRVFEIGYDLQTNRYTIPIRDELGTLVGVKSRYFYKDVPEDEDKYIYLIPCSKTRILYGLDKTYKHIKEKNEVIVVESEKSVQRLYSIGICNCVAIGGHDLSKTQVNKLTALGVEEIILCYDEDVCRLENGKVSKKLYLEEVNKFIEQQKVTIMVDIKGEILGKKESPVDNINKFNLLYENRINIRE